MSSGETHAPEGGAPDDDEEETPDIEADIVEERLRIDGICGVY